MLRLANSKAVAAILYEIKKEEGAVKGGMADSGTLADALHNQ